MEITTLRLAKEELEAIDQEASEYGYNRSEYIRRILRNRDSIHLENTQNTSEHNTVPRTEYDDRIQALEERVNQLESRLTQPPDVPDIVETDEYHTRAAIEFVEAHQPVEKAVILEAFADRVSAKPESWWERHARPALHDAGATFVRNQGWQF